MEEILKNLGWPHFTFIFLVFFTLIFKQELKALISRVTSIDKSGVTISTTPEAQREEQKKEAVQELLDPIGSSVVLRDIESRIKADLKNRGLETEGNSISILIKQLAIATILLEFEQIHGLIFGSQILLLKKLNEVVGQGRPKEFVLSHFKYFQELYPKVLGTWTLEQYLSFLMNRLLVIIQGNNYHITNLGVEYLIWIVRNGREENKPL